MEEKLQQLVYNAECALKDYDTWDGQTAYEVSMILRNSKMKDYAVLLYNTDDLAIIYFNKKNIKEINIVPGWSYDIDEIELSLLADNYQIEYFEPDLINYYWTVIGENYEEGLLNHVTGLKKIYDYCKMQKLSDKEINEYSRFNVKKFLKEHSFKNKERGER